MCCMDNVSNLCCKSFALFLTALQANEISKKIHDGYERVTGFIVKYVRRKSLFLYFSSSLRLSKSETGTKYY